MRKKTEARLCAEALRREQGLSYREIEAATGIRRSTLSGWLKHIALSPEHEARLQARLRANRGAFAARALPINRARHQQVHLMAQAAGAAVVARLPAASEVDELALAMLYLGEGSKSYGRVQMANIRVDVLRYFVASLRRLYDIDERRLTFRLHLVPAARSQEESFIRWWADELQTEPDRFQKTQYDARSVVAQLTPDYRGVCTATYADTYLMHRLMALAAAYLERSQVAG